MKTLYSILFITLLPFLAPFSPLLAQDSIRLSGRVIFEHPPNESLYLAVTATGFESRVQLDDSGNFEMQFSAGRLYHLELFQEAFILDTIFQYSDIRDTLFSFTNPQIDKIVEVENIPAFGAERARDDINKGEPILFAIYGVSSYREPCKSKKGELVDCDDLFYEKYGIKTYSFACIVPISSDKLYDYNLVTIQYLDERFGKRWRKKVNKKVVMDWD